MDFAAWPLSNTTVVIIVVIGFAVQIAVNISRTKQLEKQQHWLQADIEQLRDELRAEIRDLKTELSKMNQNHIDRLSHQS